MRPALTPVLKFRLGEPVTDAAGGLIAGVQQKLEQLRARVEGLGKTKADIESPRLLNTVTVEGFTPTTVWREVDAVGALIGLFRVRADVGGWKLQRNTAAAPAAEFSTVQDVLAVDPAGRPMLTLPDHLDDAAAATGGVPVTGLYRTGSAVKVRVT